MNRSSHVVSRRFSLEDYGDYAPQEAANSNHAPSGNWDALKSQLLLQWNKITPLELEVAGPSRHRIARVIEHKYGIAPHFAESYLRNFEHTMPRFGI